MKNKTISFVVFACILLLTACNFSPTKPPLVEKGYLNLSNWDFEKNGAIALNGEWEFYWNKLYLPTNFKNDSIPIKTGYFHVPGYWSEEKNVSEKITGIGFGTYRVKILTNTPNQMLALKILDASSSYNLFVNGVLVATNGIVDSNLSKMKPQFLPMVRAFNKTNNELEIVLQIANNFHSKGGPWSEIQLGTQEQIFSIRDKKSISDLFLIGAMFILFVYNVWIFLFRKSEKSGFWFGILCISAMIRSIVTNERFLFVLLPSFSPGVALRLEYLTICSSWLSWAFLLYYLFPKDLSKNVLRLIVITTIITVIVILFTPHYFYTSKILWIQTVVIILAFYYTGISIATLKRKRHGSIALFVSILVLFVCVINDILYSQLIINTTFIIPYGFFISLLAQAYLLASRISHALTTVELLTINLELKVEERTFQLQKEKKKSDDLLLNILPEEIAEELKKNGKAQAKQFNNVTVLFTDFVNFTGISEQLSPNDLVAEIHKNFTAFDGIMENHGLEKIKTIGDAYLAVCGLPNEDKNHAQKVINAALNIQSYMTQNNGKFQIRIGIHSGAVVAGIVGVKKFAYDIWGDTVNTASRMESNSEPGKINISQTTYELIKNDFTCEYRGKINAKNKGEVDMYFVEK